MPEQPELLDTEAKLAVAVQEFGAAPKIVADALAAARWGSIFKVWNFTLQERGGALSRFAVQGKSLWGLLSSCGENGSVNV